jgi:single-strand DNA-binding protein
MAEGLNRVMLMGNLGADPELKVTQSGTAVLKLRLATTENYLDKGGAKQTRTEWHSVVIWGKRGEALHKFLGKGSTIFVEGSLRTSSYEDRDGNKRYKTEVVASNIILAGRGGGAGRGASYDDEPGSPPAPQQQRPRPQAAAAHDDDGAGPDNFPVDDDDLPF